jgi:hypothetical protein
MNDSQTWVVHYRRRAAECIELADGSFDPGIEAHYRSLAGRYLKLAEAEEASPLGKTTACRVDWTPTVDANVAKRLLSRSNEVALTRPSISLTSGLRRARLGSNE